MRWNYDTRQDGSPAQFHGDPLLAEGLVVAGSDGSEPGYVADGETAWSGRIDGVPRGTSRDGSTLFIGTLSGAVQAYSRPGLTGNPRAAGLAVPDTATVLRHLRLVFFLAGLFTFLSWERTAPHHRPTVGRSRRWLSNLGFAAINGGIVSLTCWACLLLAMGRLAPWRFGPFETLALSPWVRLPAELALLDLLTYFLHRTYHRIPALWRLHEVHHSDLDLDVTSASRFHLGEVLVSGAAKLTVVAILGISPTGLVAFEILMVLAAQFQHANLQLSPPLERFLWLILVPPAMHRIHHHPERADHDSNFGTVLTLWDRLFGTFRQVGADPARFGLPELRDEQALGLPSLLALPFRRRRL